MARTITWSTTLVKVDCCNCGVIFGVPEDLDRANQADSKRYFSCPNGHSQHYTKSTETILREQLAEAERQRDRADTARRAARDQADAAERSAAAYRGVATKLKKRAAAGVCPCCNRSFGNLRRHMDTKHPGFADEGLPEPGSRALCAECGRLVPVLGDGTLRRHYPTAARGRNCQGSRKVPR